MNDTIVYTGRLVVTSCWCGIHMAIPDDLHSFAVRRGKTLWCPVGHTFVFNDTVVKELAEAKKRLAREQERTQATRELLTHEEHSHRATRGHLTRQKKRIAGGVCPCCTRTFKDLARHMAGQHPDYSK
jgi:hypothetical protein